MGWYVLNSKQKCLSLRLGASEVGANLGIKLQPHITGSITGPPDPRTINK